MWDAIELETDKSKLINHYFPIPEYYTSEEAWVNKKKKYGNYAVTKTLFFILAASITQYTPGACWDALETVLKKLRKFFCV